MARFNGANSPSICIFPIHTVEVLSKKFFLGGGCLSLPLVEKNAFFNEKS
jgi:hypothetical protein